ncbi:pyridoxal-dependent decarboxylase [Amycolatopsis sp. WQ 127309]|uniref:pyridoxal phosphate-dependent decarboxylase family protein n=1 Tax=Amycolatopsis sp. WQ 127309 TaxID=2932773 RepID=UPI001FF389D4|nr:pyridoxal-dependent decarboxylase [Amycolatopsis sp. WQ 127309]UOZ06901.1 pyridoxal-dependent decarboxylase [Amycolatopsis sp. WQ 127309]
MTALGPDARLAGGVDGPAHLLELLAPALEAVRKGTAERSGPLPAGRPTDAADAVRALGDALPEEGAGAERALVELARVFAAHAVDPADPACVAHLHAPPLAVAVAADVVASVFNSSLDSWDQAPSATAVETEVVEALARLVPFGEAASGVLTSGGTESNLTGLFLAREHARRTAGDRRLRVFCSAEAHFSVQRSAGVLGIGEDFVTAVDVDADHRMSPAALRTAIAEARARGEAPAAIVATAGTSDLGAIDPLREIAAIAAEAGAWLHVDAAYGGGALFSRRLAPLLDGLSEADSVGLDLHKLGWQPVAAGVLLLRDGALFAPLARRVAYICNEDDEEAGYTSLLGRSLRTTRRADALKIAVTLRALGRQGVGELVDRCHVLAWRAAALIQAQPRLELFRDPVLSSVVFRYLPERGSADEVNARLRRTLLRRGRAVIGRTEFGGAVYLKLTLLNPHTTEAELRRLVDDVVLAGRTED